MENASKALLMAGGMLIAMLTVTLLVVMFNQIGVFYSGENSAESEEEIVKFNMEYEAYNRDDVRGTELLSLLNKVINYNERKSSNGQEGSSIGYEAMTVNIDLGDNLKVFASDSGNLIFLKSKYKQDEFNNKIIAEINRINTKNGGENKMLKLAKSIESIESIENDELKKDVLKYYEYLQFKRAHFDTEFKYKNNRITTINFTFNGKIE